MKCVFSLTAIFVLAFTSLVFAVGGGGGPVVPSEQEPTEFVNTYISLVTPDGLPVASAAISLYNNKTYAELNLGVTDSNGNVSFTVGRFRGVYLVIRPLNASQFVYPAFNASENLSITVKTPGVPTKKFTFNGEELKCWELPSTLERVQCRLALVVDEPELYYVPEECRDLPDDKQQTCFKWYDEFQKCRPFPLGQSRDSCAKQKIGLGEVSVEKTACAGNSTCLSELKRKVLLFAKFKLYDLQDKAERWLRNRNASYAEVVRFIALVDQRKLEYAAAASIPEKVEVLRASQRGYIDFVRRVNGGG